MRESRSAARLRLAGLVPRRSRSGRAIRQRGKDDWTVAPTDGGSEREFRLALLLRQSRGRRNAIFGQDIFSDPAWDILLDLYVHDRSGLPVAVTNLCTGSDIPQTTVLRWVKTLSARGLVERRADVRDGRRVFVTLTADARRRMDRFLREALGSIEIDEICG